MSIQQSHNSYTTSTNVRFGAMELPDLWWNVLDFEMPTISIDTSKFNTRAGAAAGINADTCSYTDFSVEVIIDKKWETYKQLFNYFLSGLNVETAKFSHYKHFDLWIAFYDGKGNETMKFWINSARVTEFGGVVATPNDDGEKLQTVNISFSILYFQPDIGENPFANLYGKGSNLNSDHYHAPDTVWITQKLPIDTSDENAYKDNSWYNPATGTGGGVASGSGEGPDKIISITHPD